MRRSHWVLKAVLPIVLAGWWAQTAPAEVIRESVESYPGQRAVGVVTDASGTYVAGTSLFDASHHFYTDLVLLKYSLEGELLWAREFDEPDDATFGEDFASHMVLDPQGNVLVTGGSYLTGSGQDFITLKYDPNGNLLWKARYTQTSVGAVRVGVDAASNVYIVGPSSSNAAARNYVTIKYDANGVQQWVRTYNNSFDDNPRGLAVTPDGRVAVTGQSTGGVTVFDFATIVYDTDGNQLWLQRYNDPQDSADYAYDVVFGPANEVYVAGYSLGDATLVKYGATGTFEWVRTNDGPAHLSDLFNRVRVDSNGDVVVAGYVQTPSFYTDLLLAKYDPNGELLWDDIYTGQMESDDMVENVVLDANDDICVVGASDSGILTARYLSSGQRLWLDVFVPGPTLNRGYAIAIDAEGDVVSVGQSPMVTLQYDQSATTGVQELAGSGLAGAVAVLEPARPNPARHNTTLRFQLLRPSHASLRVYDISGRVVATLLDRSLEAGSHEVVFAPMSLSSGVYLYALEAGGERFSGRLEWLR